MPVCKRQRWKGRSLGGGLQAEVTKTQRRKGVWGFRRMNISSVAGVEPVEERARGRDGAGKMGKGHHPKDCGLHIPPQLEEALHIKQSRHGLLCLSSKGMMMSETSYFRSSLTTKENSA